MWKGICLAAVLLGIVVTFGYGVGRELMQRPEIEAHQIGSALLMSWNSTAADLYEVQVRVGSGDWRTVTFTQPPMLMLSLPGAGAYQFRVRGWTKTGYGRWSRPTEQFLLAADPDEEEEEPEEEALFAPWTEES